MDLGLREQGVIVTGAASNIGRAIALAFAAEGARLAILDIDEAGAEAVAAEARRLGAADAVPYRCDVTEPEQVERALTAARERWGTFRVLVNNVGWDRLGLFLEESWESIERKLRLNLWSTLVCCRLGLPHLVEQRGGAVVNISSDAGRIGEFREATYSACKAGVIALTKALAREYGRYGVRANCVCPGTIIPREGEAGAQSMWRSEGLGSWDTPEMRERIARAYPLRRLGTADEVARVVVFLASEAASFVTGQTVSVSGGYTMV